MKRRPEWFAPKRFGYGFGFPIAWQGWAVFLAYCVLLYLATQYFEPPSSSFWLAVAILTALFVLMLISPPGAAGDSAGARTTSPSRSRAAG